MIKDLDIDKTIQSTERFDTYSAKLKDEQVFVKRAKTEKTKELLAGIPKNSQVVNRLGTKSADFTFRAPDIYFQGGEWLVTEWIEGESLGTALVSDPQMVADVLSEFLVVFDREKVVDNGFRQIFTPAGLAGRMQERIPKSLRGDQKKILADAKNLFKNLHPFLKPALQDADIKPDHIFPDLKKGGAYILVDSEHLGPQWPRFYDLGNNFAKFWVRQQKDFSNTLLKTFMNQSGLSEGIIFKSLLATLIVRGISLHWEADYDPGAESYNIPRAQEMFKTCLAANNLDDLLY